MKFWHGRGIRGWVRAWVWVIVLQLACRTMAETVPVRFAEGAVHGFLELRTKENELICVGDLFQVVHGGRVTSRLMFHFKDGSIDDETSVFTQRGNFQLISDHHVQKGPSFPHPLDVSIDAKSGQVTVRSTGKDGKENTANEHLKLPADLANGVIFSLLKNIKKDAQETKVSMVLANPKPRLVKLVITPKGEETYSIAEAARRAVHYAVKIELGGAAGMIAPLIGKQPPDIQVWIGEGETPAFLKSEGPFFEGGPIWVIQLASPVWPK